MPALTRRRDRNLPQECRRVYYGDVHAGTIMQCVGNPGAAPKWQMRATLRRIKEELRRRMHEQILG